MLNRRQFIRSAAATGAAFHMAYSSELKPNRLRCGILGLDHAHGLDVLKVLQESPDYELVGVCEPDDTVAARFASLPAAQGVTWLTKDELLRDKSVSMIAVESGVPRLLALAREAVDAGKHVHMDKPAGASLPEFDALLNAARERSLLFQMGYMFRYNPGFDFIRRAVKEGWLGRIHSISASICTDLDSTKRERIAQFPGGLMFELGCHLIDMTVLLLGPPSKVTPFIRHDSSNNDALADNTLAVLEFPHTIVTVESSAMEPQAFATRRFKIVGENGSIVLNPIEPPSARLALRDGAGGFEKGSHTVAFDDLERHVLDFADLAACIRGERTFAYDKDRDLLVQKTVLQAGGMPAAM
ncbi:MAG: Gfo/Idh/MocA family oxidoreductase [Candidatus Hydrogenedentes bacterium]|nr:Gfo/Idh/MocA family oxidoreductase [Candidatus Hydrogenedentota bacterium]